METCRIFFATDIHGSESCFLKFLNSSKLYKANILVLGGDLSGKTLVPIVKDSDNRYGVSFLGRNLALTSEMEVKMLEKRIRSMGSYPHLTYPEEMAELEANPASLDRLFSNLIVERMKQWVTLAEGRLRGTSLKLFVTGGNDDLIIIDEVLRNSPVVTDPEGLVVKVDGSHEMLSCAWTNPTPWETPRECSEDELYERLRSLTLQVTSMERCIFNIHAPPVGSGLDTCQEVDKQFRPVFAHGHPVVKDCGSTAVRRIIEECQPILGLHGHIHEARGIAKIGRTLCLNPGSEYSQGILRGVIVDLEPQRVRRYLFVSG